MKLRTYGSGSKGNTHTLTSSTGQTLVLDAGVRPTQLFRDIPPSTINGVLITHQHGDHAAYAKKYSDNCIDVYAPFERNYTNAVESGQVFHVGEFKVQALKMHHDVPCLGYLIRHEELVGDILYATDTHHISWSFDDLSLAIIEADFDARMLRENVITHVIPRSVAERTAQTHQSLSKALLFVKHNIKNVFNVVFCHLSENNAEKGYFLEEAKRHIDVPLYVAQPGFELEITKYDIFK